MFYTRIVTMMLSINFVSELYTRECLKNVKKKEAKDVYIQIHK